MAQQPIIGRPRPPEASDYLQFPTRAGIALFVGVLAVCAYVEFRLWYVLPFAVWGFFSTAFIIRQAQSFDRQVEYAMNPIVTIEHEPPPPVVQTAYANVRETPAGRETVYGDYALDEGERARLATWILRQGGVSRDGLVMLGIRGLPDMKRPTQFAKTGYEELLNRWGRGGLGWLEGSRLTDEGRAHFEQFGQRKQPLPEHSPAPPLQYQTANLVEATDDETTRRR